jgi:hypothetical protein
MDELCFNIITNAPAHGHSPAVTPPYSELRSSFPAAEDCLNELLNQLKTKAGSSDSEAADVVRMMAYTCVSSSLSPDQVEQTVEALTAFGNAHPTWLESLRWILTLIHYHCTDEMTLSIFAEFDVPALAVKVLSSSNSDYLTSTAACVVLSHFNFYPIGRGMTQIAIAMRNLCSSDLLCLMACRTVAEFTSFYSDSSTQMLDTICREFSAEGGLASLELVMQKHDKNEELQLHACRIIANLTSTVQHLVNDDTPIIRNVVAALKSFSSNDLLCCHAFRALGNTPRSHFLDIAVVCDVFEKRISSEIVAQEGVRCVSCIAMLSKDLKPVLFANGTAAVVLDAMRKWSGNPIVQEDACTFCSYMSFDNEVIAMMITSSGGIPLVLTAMQTFSANQRVLTAACAALSGLTFNNIQGQQIVVENEGVRHVIAAMKAGVMDNACLAIGTMCWNSDLKADVVRLGGIPAIVKALEQGFRSSGVVKNACRALAQIAFNSDRYRDEMSAAGAIPLIIKGMSQHPASDRVQMHGCVALSYLSWTCEANANQISDHDGYSVITDAMRSFPNNHEVQEHACRALANVFRIGPTIAIAALEQIVAAMRRHETSSEVHEEACRAMVTLSIISPTYKDKLFELNAAERVIAAMRNFPKVHLVQQEAANALAHLVYEHPALNRAVTELDGVTYLLNAMRAFPNSPKVQLNTCGGLSALAFDNAKAQLQTFTQGGVELILQGMNRFDRLRMMELGCSVLGTLAWNSEIKEKVAQLAIPEILNAMQENRDTPVLQKSTCRAISQFAFNSESNRKKLIESGAIPLVVQAMADHIQSDKLVLHALKALSYLCWENAVVAQMILDCQVEGILTKLQENYGESHRVSLEASHLSKILLKKCSTPQHSPLAASPTPVTNSDQTPGKISDVVVPPTPPQCDREDFRAQLYNAPHDASVRNTGGRGNGKGGKERTRREETTKMQRSPAKSPQPQGIPTSEKKQQPIKKPVDNIPATAVFADQLPEEIQASATAAAEASKKPKGQKNMPQTPPAVEQISKADDPEKKETGKKRGKEQVSQKQNQRGEQQNQKDQLQRPSEAPGNNPSTQKSQVVHAQQHGHKEKEHQKQKQPEQSQKSSQRSEKVQPRPVQQAQNAPQPQKQLPNQQQNQQQREQACKKVEHTHCEQVQKAQPKHLPAQHQDIKGQSQRQYQQQHQQGPKFHGQQPPLHQQSGDRRREDWGDPNRGGSGMTKAQQLPAYTRQADFDARRRDDSYRDRGVGGDRYHGQRRNEQSGDFHGSGEETKRQPYAQQNQPLPESMRQRGGRGGGEARRVILNRDFDYDRRRSENYRDPERIVEVVIPSGDLRFQHRPGRGTGGPRNRDASDDLWDDPDPVSFHGVRRQAPLNWQMEALERDGYTRDTTGPSRQYYQRY